MSEKVYKIQVDSFTRKRDADECYSELLEKGYPCELQEGQGYYRCFVGSFSSESSARNMLDDVKISGYRNSFIVLCQR